MKVFTSFCQKKKGLGLWSSGKDAGLSSQRTQGSTPARPAICVKCGQSTSDDGWCEECKEAYLRNIGYTEIIVMDEENG